MSRREEFHYHQGIAPMMWVIFALSLIELFAVHFFVALKWPTIGWTLTAISAVGAIWILFWIRSFRTRPHARAEGALELNLGNLKSVRIELDNVARVRRTLEQGALQKKGVLNLAGLAYPNRVIELVQPIGKGRDRVFVRLDDPARFDAALEAKDVTFE